MTLNLQKTTHCKFGIIKLWPGVQVAEDENIQRIKRSASSLNIECVELDWRGRLIDVPHTKMTADDLDFVIHLHFETPKVYDIFSFYTLWNPPQFLHDWGYAKFTDNLLTHDDYLSCGGPKADQMIMRRMTGDAFFSPDFCTMYHSLSEPVLEPTLGSLKLFYVGVNWERVNNSKGRHHDLLVMLDERSLIKIYGPTELQGVRVWEGFKSYVGELPFDGTSCVHAIHDAGIGLVLSSEAHKDAEMVSNRIFEAVAAGTIVISDENAFIKKHFGDSVLYIDTDREASNVVEQIEKHLAWIKSYPDDAFEKIRKTQQIFLEKFSLDQSIEAIYRSLPTRKSLKCNVLSDPDRKAVPEAVCLFFCLPWDSDQDLEEICRTIRHQSYENLTSIVLVDESLTDLTKVFDMAKRHNVNLQVRKTRLFYGKNQTHRRNRGEMIMSALVENRDMAHHSWVCFIEPHEKIFSDHIIRLVTAAGCAHQAAACPIIFYDQNSNDVASHGVLWPTASNLFKKYPIATASMLFRWSNGDLHSISALTCLDRLALLGLSRQLEHERTIKPTVMLDTAHPWASLPSKTTIAQERCYIRDLNPWQTEAEQTAWLFEEEITNYFDKIPRVDQLFLSRLTRKQKRRTFFKLLKPALIPHFLYSIRDMLHRWTRATSSTS